MALKHNPTISLKPLPRVLPRLLVLLCYSGRDSVKENYHQMALAMLLSAWTHTGIIPLPSTPTLYSLSLPYRWMFDCCRIPGVPVDWSISYASSSRAAIDLTHIVVVRKNRFWKVNVEVEGKVLGMAELMRCTILSVSSHTMTNNFTCQAVPVHL